MSTQADRRRQQVGLDNTKSRQETGRKVRDDMRALAANERQSRVLPVLEKRGAIAASRGFGEFVEAVGGSSGIDGPLVEDPDTRVYGSEVCVIPPAGYFAYCATPVVEMTFKGPQGAELVVTFDETNYMRPPEPEPEP